MLLGGKGLTSKVESRGKSKEERSSRVDNGERERGRREIQGIGRGDEKENSVQTLFGATGEEAFLPEREFVLPEMQLCRRSDAMPRTRVFSIMQFVFLQVNLYLLPSTFRSLSISPLETFSCFGYPWGTRSFRRKAFALGDGLTRERQGDFESI